MMQTQEAYAVIATRHDRLAAEKLGEYRRRQVTVVTKNAKPILDTETGKEYTSMYKAGQELACLVAGDPKNRLVWFAVQRAFPGRFQTKDLDTGSWVPLKAAAGKARAEKSAAQQTAAAAASPQTPVAAQKSVATRVVPPEKTRKTTVKKATNAKTTSKKTKIAAGKASRTRRIA